MPSRSQKKRYKQINKRLGRDKTIKNTNKNRGKGTTKTNLGQGVSKCWNGVCEKVDDVFHKDSKKRKTKTTRSKKQTTIDKDPSGKKDGLNFPNFSLSGGLNFGSGTLKGIGGSLKGRIQGRRNNFLNIDSEDAYYEDEMGNMMT